MALFDAFPKGSLRFVGGCVRNAVMGARIGDIDLATTLEPKDVEAALKAHKIKYVPTGITHGTITAVIEGKPFEITSLRKMLRPMAVAPLCLSQKTGPKMRNVVT